MRVGVMTAAGALGQSGWECRQGGDALSRRKGSMRHRLRPRSLPAPNSKSTFAMLAGLAVILLALVAVLILRPPRHTHRTAEPLGQASGPSGPLAAQSPATRGELPPLPELPHRADRSAEGIRAAYEYAARHPEILSYVPCFCGCEKKGHRSNHDCFIASRDAEGRVGWSSHGMT